MSFAGYHPDIDPAYLASDRWSGSVELCAAQGAAAVSATSPNLDDGLKQPSLEQTNPEKQQTEANAQLRSAFEHLPSADRLNTGAIRGLHSTGGSRRRKPTHIKHVVDANGRRRSYYCRGGKPFIRLTGKPGSPEFRASYSEAIQIKMMLRRITPRPQMPAR
ncbi:MAG: hypothetical protein ABL901_20605, partial [Hyphomicrobiaceae bacterium]